MEKEGNLRNLQRWRGLTMWPHYVREVRSIDLGAPSTTEKMKSLKAKLLQCSTAQAEWVLGVGKGIK